MIFLMIPEIGKQPGGGTVESQGGELCEQARIRNQQLQQTVFAGREDIRQKQS